jgi:hypothetical protein
MLRRILAITLLIAFGFPLVAPAFAATTDPEASLPACCRSHGAHHCAMLHNLAASPAFQAPPCPFYPTRATLVNTAAASLVIAQPPTATLFRTLAPLPATPRPAARILLASANLKRGPPASIA